MDGFQFACFAFIQYIYHVSHRTHAMVYVTRHAGLKMLMKLPMLRPTGCMLGVWVVPPVWSSLGGRVADLQHSMHKYQFLQDRTFQAEAAIVSLCQHRATGTLFGRQQQS